MICGVRRARELGMMAPTKVQARGDHFFVSDLLANKVFMFHESGEFITQFRSASIRNPRTIAFEEASISICQSDGVLIYPLANYPTYEFKPDCIRGSSSPEERAPQWVYSAF